MKNDRLFNALVESENDPTPDAGVAVSADDLQAFEKRIVENINAKLAEKLDSIKRTEKSRTETATTETETTKVETVETEKTESEEN